MQTRRQSVLLEREKNSQSKENRDASTDSNQQNENQTQNGPIEKRQVKSRSAARGNKNRVAKARSRSQNEVLQSTTAIVRDQRRNLTQASNQNIHRYELRSQQTANRNASKTVAPKQTQKPKVNANGNVRRGRGRGKGRGKGKGKGRGRGRGKGRGRKKKEQPADNEPVNETDEPPETSSSIVHTGTELCIRLDRVDLTKNSKHEMPVEQNVHEEEVRTIVDQAVPDNRRIIQISDITTIASVDENVINENVVADDDGIIEVIETMSNATTFFSSKHSVRKSVSNTQIIRKRIIYTKANSDIETYSQPLTKRQRIQSVDVRATIAIQSSGDQAIEEQQLIKHQTINVATMSQQQGPSRAARTRPINVDGEEDEEQSVDEENTTNSNESVTSYSDYQNLYQPIYATQPTQATRLSYHLHRKSSLETNLGSILSASRSTNITRKDSSPFPISSQIFYSSIVEYGQIRFAVNHFAQNDGKVKYHFLSRFNRAHYLLNRNFNGIVFTTSITASLLVHYLDVNPNVIQIMNFNEPIELDGIKVTAIKVVDYPGSAIFSFELTENSKVLHVGDLRLPAGVENDDYFWHNKIDKIFFDPSMLMQTVYQIPIDIDRYVDLLEECAKYDLENQRTGLIGMIAIGAFEIGMESLILRLAQALKFKVWMDTKRCDFLEQMLANEVSTDTDDITDLTIHQLRQQVVMNPRKAHIHIMDVENMHYGYLSDYMAKPVHSSFHRVMGIRPRGCDKGIQMAMDSFVKIIDIPNPLIGDACEYQRFLGYAFTN